jgi:Zn-dependent peptidase ImmA (M78 family)
VEELIFRKFGEEYGKTMTSATRSTTFKKLRQTLSIDVEDLLKKNMMASPPFEPSKVHKIGHATIEFEYVPRNEIGADGCIQATSKGFLLKVDQTLVEKAKHKHRLRSTATHELMHTFFYDTTVLPPIKLGLGDVSREHFLMEEELCHYLTRVFLMPTFSVLDLVSKDKSIGFPSVRNIGRLKSIFVISSEIVAYRMITDLSIWNSVFVKLVQEGTLFRSKTRLKNKTNRLYRKMTLPKYIPEREPRNEWLRRFSNHILKTVEERQFEELMPLGGSIIALESKIETVDPLSIVTLAYEENSTD